MWRTPLADDSGVIAASDDITTDLQGITTMYEYEVHQARSAELLRRAEHERLAREAVRGRRAARREATERAALRESSGDSTRESAESEPHTRRPRRLRFPRTA
ncbi:hypothetical protein [Streptomyces phaeofaciens]|uniref:hypothetical protein n=1 Tax=Streptomyces phaeofaciens TaxID=68254 RepID=UPI0036C6E242